MRGMTAPFCFASARHRTKNAPIVEAVVRMAAESRISGPVRLDASQLFATAGANVSEEGPHAASWRCKMPNRFHEHSTIGRKRSRGGDWRQRCSECFLARWVFSVGDLRAAPGRDDEELYGPAGAGVVEADAAA